MTSTQTVSTVASCVINTHYVVIRADLPVGVQLAQTIHAAGESSPGNLEPGTYAVALVAPDEDALLRLEAHLQFDHIPHVAIREPDSPYLGALMAVGFPPGDRRMLRRYLAKFPLAGKDTP